MTPPARLNRVFALPAAFAIALFGAVFLLGAGFTAPRAFTLDAAGVAHKADLWITDLSGRIHGRNVYCAVPCTRQIVRGSGRHGRRRTFTVTLQNDADETDSIVVSGPGTTHGIKVRYSCCSSPLRAHTNPLAPNDKVTFTVTLTITSSATYGSTAFKIRGKAGTTKDVVEILITVTRASGSRLLA